jgi:hypothetical protein
MGMVLGVRYAKAYCSFARPFRVRTAHPTRWWSVLRRHSVRLVGSLNRITENLTVKRGTYLGYDSHALRVQGVYPALRTAGLLEVSPVKGALTRNFASRLPLTFQLILSCGQPSPRSTVDLCGVNSKAVIFMRGRRSQRS